MEEKDIPADPPQRLARAIDGLFREFKGHPTPKRVSNCLVCYTTDELEEIRKTPLRNLAPHLAGMLLRETGDHWQDNVAYRHFLPRALEVMAPPIREYTLYPAHLGETLAFHRFPEWPASERAAVYEFLDAWIAYLVASSNSEAVEWSAAVQKLGARPLGRK